jgi:hypothetical protein
VKELNVPEQHKAFIMRTASKGRCYFFFAEVRIKCENACEPKATIYLKPFQAGYLFSKCTNETGKNKKQ